jgi:hypothetical protein
VVEEAPEEACCNGRKGDDRSPEDQPSGLVPRQRVLAAPHGFNLRAINDDLPAPYTERKASEVACAPVEFSMLIVGAVRAADLPIKEWEPIAPCILSGDMRFADVRKSEILRERDAVAGSSHGLSPKRQPYGYAFMSPCPLPV